MALIPFRVSGPAADASLEERIIQIGCYTLVIKQVRCKSAALDCNQAYPVLFFPFPAVEASSSASSPTGYSAT